MPDWLQPHSILYLNIYEKDIAQRDLYVIFFTPGYISKSTTGWI